MRILCRKMVKRLARLGRKLPRFKYDLDMAVVEEAGSSFPAGQGIADCLCKLGLLADQDELGTQWSPSSCPGGQQAASRQRPMASDSIAQGPAMRLSASLAISAGPADSDFVEAAGTWDK